MLEIFNTFGLGDEDKVKIDVVIKKFEEHYTPKKNVAYEQHVFNMWAQGVTEGIDAYVTELCKLARNCEFGELHYSIIHDRIVCGIRSNEVRKCLLREKDLNLERAVDLNNCQEQLISRNWTPRTQLEMLALELQPRFCRNLTQFQEQAPDLLDEVQSVVLG